MTHLTPHDEIVRRCRDESERCDRWTTKECSKKSPEFETLDLPDEVHDIVEGRGGFKFKGYMPWTSPKNGDRWISLVFENSRTIDGAMYRVHSITNFYYWETVGSFGFIGNIQFPYAKDVTRCTRSYFIFTDHCMQRIRERLLRGATPLETIIFIYLTLNYSAVYTYPRGKQTGMAIVTPFGEFRMIYREDTLADTVNTFIATEQMDEYNRKRYDKYWKMACENVFNKTDNQILNDDGNTHELQEGAPLQGPGTQRSGGHPTKNCWTQHFSFGSPSPGRWFESPI